MEQFAILVVLFIIFPKCQSRRARPHYVFQCSMTNLDISTLAPFCWGVGDLIKHIFHSSNFIVLSITEVKYYCKQKNTCILDLTGYYKSSQHGSTVQNKHKREKSISCLTETICSLEKIWNVESGSVPATHILQLCMLNVKYCCLRMQNANSTCLWQYINGQMTCGRTGFGNVFVQPGQLFLAHV